jgi:signal transduction histidine kinase
LFIRAPLFRWPVALVLCGVILNRLAFLLDTMSLNPLAPFDLVLLSTLLASTLYSFALFRFGMFDPIPMARNKVIEQMREGMLVLDAAGKIAELNPAAENILQLPAPKARGQELYAVLPITLDLSAPPDEPQTIQSEVSVGTGPSTRYYALSLSPMRDPRGLVMGHLLLLHDVTRQKLDQAYILEQRQALAALQERERLARELHDGAGQVLGYASMQAQAIRKHLRDGNTAAAEAQLTRLATAAAAAHIDIRESILNLRAGSGASVSFLATLRQYLAAYGDNYGIHAELALLEDLEEDDFAPDTGVQLLRVIGEALTNARKHSGCACVRVSLTREGGQVRIIIADDGNGFDAGKLAAGETHFGLEFMRERMVQVGGALEIDSRPGGGTQVALGVPVRDKHGEGYERLAG